MERDIRQATFDNFTSAPTPYVARGEKKGGAEREALYQRYAKKLLVVPALTRSLVSFQANKHAPFYRWFKYREGFSSDLVSYLLEHLETSKHAPPRVLDPFAGSGTTLTTTARAGWHATGIELLPVGAAAIRARLTADVVDVEEFQKQIIRLSEFPLVSSSSNGYRFQHIRITAQAFTEQTEQALAAYMVFLDGIPDKDVRYLFWFACLSILEDVSYTRKDGQYLRWDNRSGRTLKAAFDKGMVSDFRTAITHKLQLIIEDIKMRNRVPLAGAVDIIEGSCLTELPKLSSDSFDLVITSPPYCNRYDYTRTYALELAFLGYGEEEVKRLRQTMLSCTVENKTKREWLDEQYKARGSEGLFIEANNSFVEQKALQEVLNLIRAARDDGRLNNKNIYNLVENYFFEMSFVIHELARVLAPGGRVVMVNDNVQYVGEEIPADLILSDFAERAGLSVEHIWVLPRGKGNSSQQMGEHGRNELRKCVYVWSKPAAA